MTVSEIMQLSYSQRFSAGQFQKCWHSAKRKICKIWSSLADANFPPKYFEVENFTNNACDVTLRYPHRAGLKNMPGHDGNRTYDLWNTNPWIYTQSNITSILFTWVHYTNTANIFYHWYFRKLFCPWKWTRFPYGTVVIKIVARSFSTARL
jgi:hypothetical protein